MVELSPETEKYLHKINQPEIFGPGIWRTLHLLALDANDYGKKTQFIHNVEYILKEIPCLKPCREDSLAYLQNNPITKYWNIVDEGKDLGMFYWTVDFHNYVNRKLEKPEIPRDLAYQFYIHPDKFVCQDGNCGDNTTKKIKKKVKRKTSSHLFIPL